VAAWSGELYAAGQITVDIRLSSVKLKSGSGGGLCSGSGGGSDWVSLSDVESHIDLLHQSAAAMQRRRRAAAAAAASRPPARIFKSPPTPSSRHRYRLQQVLALRRFINCDRLVVDEIVDYLSHRLIAKTLQLCLEIRNETLFSK